MSDKNKNKNVPAEVAPATATDLAPVEFGKNPVSVLTTALDTVTEESFELSDGKVIKDKALVSAHAKIALLNAARKISDKATAIVLARLTPKDAQRVGCKDVVDFAVKAFGKDLTSEQIRDYIRVGKVFGNLKGEGYHWKDAIPEDVTVTNLRDCLSLVFEDAKTKDEKDVYKLKDSELNSLYDKFITRYRENEDDNDNIPLQSTNKFLREWKTALAKKKKEQANTIGNTTATPLSEGQTPEGQQDGQTPEEVQTDERKDNFIIALNEGLALYRDNADVEQAILAVIALIG